MSTKTAKARMSRMSTPSPQMIESYRQAFDMYDEDKNGVIDYYELERMVTKLQKGVKPTRAELQKMMEEVDMNGDGKIDFPEFCYLMTRMVNDDDPEEEIKRVFKHFDKDHNGTIDLNEIKEMFDTLGLNLSDKEIEDIMKLMDENGDGVIDYAEFRKAYIKFSLKGMIDI